MDLRTILGVHAPWQEILLRTVLVYIVVLVGLRITGRRQLGQMTPFDLVLILLISNAVQNAMVGPDTTVFGGLAAAGTLLLLNSAVEWVTGKFPALRVLLQGEPVLLVRDGKILAENLGRQGIPEEEVMEAVREHGFEHASDVHLAYLEVDGTISIIPKDAKVLRSKRVVRRRHRARASRPGGN